ncbi:MAG: hypothetical protein WC766_06410 [Patescibacteria group bacterium]|jgi:hypothetical protein
MSKSASVSAVKWAQRAGSAASDFVNGAKNTTKDQAQAAIAGFENYKSALTASFAKGSFAKGLQKSGKTGWLNGITEKGEGNFAAGVMAPAAQSKYSTESARFDGARGAAASMPRGPKGSPSNLARVAAVANAQHAVKIA